MKKGRLNLLDSLCFFTLEVGIGVNPQTTLNEEVVMWVLAKSVEKD